MPLILLLFAVFGIVASMVPRRQVQDAWTEAARRLRVQLKPAGLVGWPEIVGRFGDVSVKVSVYSTGGKNSQRFTSYEIRHPPAGPVVIMTKQGAMSGLFNAQAVQAFEELWRGSPAEPAAQGWYRVAGTPDPPPLASIPPPRPEDAVDQASAPPPPTGALQASPPAPKPAAPPVTEAEPVAPEPASPVAASPVAVSQVAVLADIFDTDRMSWEVAEHFEAAHRNNDVDWSGTVASFDPYERDRDFDGGPGVKAIVLVGHIGRPGIISNEIHAVVELEAGVRLREGQQIRFSGVLANVDRFSRKVWVRYAALA